MKVTWDEQEHTDNKPPKRHRSLLPWKRQIKLLEAAIWAVQDSDKDPVGKADALAKLLRVFREVQANDLEEKLIVVFEEIERLKQVLERRSVVRKP